MRRYNTHTLASGLRIIHCRQEGEVAYCGYAIKAGARDEEEGEEGLAHFCEHLSFKGTEHLSPMQVINSIERVGGELNAYTAKEETMYYATILKQYFFRAVDTLTDMVFHSTYPQDEIAKEREVICDEIDSYRDSPAELIYDDFENRLLPRHPLGHNVLGTKESVRSFRTADCLRFTGRHYRPDNAVFYVLGDIDFSTLVKRLERQLPSAAPSAQPPCVVQRDAPATLSQLPQNRVVCDDTQQTHQCHVMTGTVLRHDLESRRMPLFLLNNMLGGPSMNSRLNIALREKRGLVYTVEGIMTTYSDTILWGVYYGCDKTDLSRCRRLVHGQTERFRKRALTPSALRAAKTQMKGQIALAAQQQESFAIDMAKQYLHRGTLRSMERLCRQIDSVSSADILSLANDAIGADRLFTLVYR